jgi:hypothetical protein
MIVRRKWMVLTAVAVVLMLAPTASAGSAPASVTITAAVDSFAEWAVAAPSITAGDWFADEIPVASFSAVNQTLTASLAMTLYANVAATLTPSSTGTGILTYGTETLSTSYMITGNVTVPDSDYELAGTGSGQFFASANTYTVTYAPGGGSYTINLLVQAVSPADRAPDAGDYICNVTLTASW